MVKPMPTTAPVHLLCIMNIYEFGRKNKYSQIFAYVNILKPSTMATRPKVRTQSPINYNRFPGKELTATHGNP
jgi:hypothetical protein